jgi:uncharacterized Zn finger protein
MNVQPCPVCGGKNIVAIMHNDHKFTAKCVNCGRLGPKNIDITDCLKDWNEDENPQTETRSAV